MQRKHARVLFVLSSALFCFMLLRPQPAEALLKKSKIKKNSPPTDVAQNYPYRVFFIIEPVSGSSSSKKWLEINYKLVNGAETPGPLFPGTPGGKVRFLDKDGFVLASDFFLNEDFQKADFYSSMLVEKKRAGAIVSADAQPLRDGELESLRRDRADKAEQRKREDELYQMAVGRISESPSTEPEKLPDVSGSPTPGASVAPSPVSSAPMPSEKPSETSLPVAASSSPSPAVRPEASSAAPAASVAPEVSPISVPSQTGTSAQSPTPAPSVPPEAQKQVTAESQPVKIPASSPDKKKDLLDLGGTTNDDIQDTLSELTQKPGTEIQESPSQIPGISSEEAATETIEP